MPHRPERSGLATATTGSLGAPAYSKLNGLTGDDAARIMRPNTVGYAPPAGVVSPLVNNKAWLSAQDSGLRGMVPSLENRKSSDSTDRSVSTKQDEESTVATLATEGSAEDLERREATASALLLVSTAAAIHDSKDAEVSAAGSAPLKKRKKHLDFLRRNSEDAKDSNDSKCDPCHVSPVSHASSGARVEGRTISSEEVTPERPGRRLSHASQRTDSYDSKESPLKTEGAQELMNTSKIHSTRDISLQSPVSLPHFPSVLYTVLSDSEYAGSVITWLPDGEAWKVLRWDALRREVLPRYFPNIRDENGSGCGTIDAFLWHLTSWGFIEIKDGTDVGAYKHELFIRGAQKLCSKMRPTGDAALKAPNTVSPARSNHGDDRAMLQVPTLGSGPRGDSVRGRSDASPPEKRSRYEEPSAALPVPHVHRQSPDPATWMGYRGEDPYAEHSAWGRYYPEAARMYPGHLYHDSRFSTVRPTHSPHIGTSPSMYSPPQVRSGRGAMRVSSGKRSPPPAQPTRSAFPVSTRGKGRKAAISRTSVDASTEAKSQAISTPSSGKVVNGVNMEEAERIGKSVQGVAIAVSRKTKRKLPLARNLKEETTTPQAAQK